MTRAASVTRTAQFRALAAHNPPTVVHSERVAALARAAAPQVGLDPGLAELAALAHDLGKLHLPVAYIDSARSLTDAEMTVTRLHAAAGQRACQTIGLPEQVATVARSHHERLDGGGYPDGLHGTQISPLTRLISVCDVLEAATSTTRAYQPVPLTFAQAARMLRGGAGRLFDAAHCEAVIEAAERDGPLAAPVAA